MDQHNISFNKGIHRTPGMNVADGELSELVNLIPENGELVNIKPPTSVKTDGGTDIQLPEGARLMAVHQVGDEVHYVFLAPGDGEIVVPEYPEEPNPDGPENPGGSDNSGGNEEPPVISYTRNDISGSGSYTLDSNTAIDKLVYFQTVQTAGELTLMTDNTGGLVEVPKGTVIGVNRKAMPSITVGSQLDYKKYGNTTYSEIVSLTDGVKFQYNGALPNNGGILSPDVNDEFYKLPSDDFKVGYTVERENGFVKIKLATRVNYGYDYELILRANRDVDISDDTRYADYIDGNVLHKGTTFIHVFQKPIGDTNWYLGLPDYRISAHGFIEASPIVFDDIPDYFDVCIVSLDQRVFLYDTAVSAQSKPTGVVIEGGTDEGNGDQPMSLYYISSVGAEATPVLIGKFEGLKQVQPLGVVLSMIFEGQSRPMSWLIWNKIKHEYKHLEGFPDVKLDFSLRTEEAEQNDSLVLDVVHYPGGVKKVLNIGKMRLSKTVHVNTSTSTSWYYIKQGALKQKGFNSGDKVAFKIISTNGPETFKLHYVHDVNMPSADRIIKIPANADDWFVPQNELDGHEIYFHTYMTNDDECVEYRFKFIDPPAGMDFQLIIGKIDSITEVTVPASLEAKNNLLGFDNVRGVLCKFVSENAKKNKLVAPFFIQYGLRLFDGSVVNVSAPIMMAPCLGPNPLCLYGGVDAGSSGETTVNTMCYGRVAVIRTRLRQVSENWEEWSEIVKSVVVAVSTQFPYYNLEDLWNGEQISLLSHDITVKAPPIDQCYCVDYDHSIIEGDALYLPTGAYDKIGMKFMAYPTLWSREKWIDKMVDKLPYSRIVKEYEFLSVRGVSTAWHDMEMQSGIFDDSRYSSLEALLPNSSGLHFASIYPKIMSSMNGRLVIGDVSVKYQNSNTLPSPREYRYTYTQRARFIVYLNIGHKEICIDSGWQNLYVWNSFICFPDRRATRYILLRKEGGKLRCYEGKLKAHAIANIAYTYNYYDKDTDGRDITEQEITELEDKINRLEETTLHEANALYQSDASNPFSFNMANSFTVGNGTIHNFGFAGKALSSGTSFGAYSLYCFCSDGIWPLETRADGTLNAPCPVSRDVCTNGESVTQVDGSLMYATAEGLKMITGENTTLLTDVLNGYNVDEAEFMEDMKTMEGYGDLVVPETSSIVELVRTCICVPDYEHGMLHVYPRSGSNISQSSGMGKHYVFSFRSKEWSTMVDENSPIVAAIPGWPYYIMQRNDGKLMQFKEEAQQADVYRKGVVLTRPNAFGAPFTRKVLMDLRMLYNRMGKNKCTIQVYVSDDGARWRKLKSLKAHSYKWYRFRIRTSLNDKSSLMGLTCIAEERWKNKLR